WLLMSLAAAVAWQRGEGAGAAWLVWPASVVGAVVAHWLIRLLERFRRLDELLGAMLPAGRASGHGVLAGRPADAVERLELQLPELAADRRAARSETLRVVGLTVE